MVIRAVCNYVGVCVSNNLGKYGLLIHDQVVFHVFSMNLFFILLKCIHNFQSGYMGHKLPESLHVKKSFFLLEC